ncbi:glycosyltransferase family 39 protein [Amycolatopsis anabasis]|uniref:glycosyltransferase family 39 protein n=1 Tax=Amycolatopsis anabasis TaxID=1840409 RepID=UPI00131DBA95|nr:glycosyltransferase family 39 protein [Amycolatopsis anabasis]
MATIKITENQTARAHVSVPALARGPVFAVAGAVGLLLFVLSGRYGYFGDELYFLAAGRHLAWGYADQPPVLPLLARAMDTLAPGSLTVLRLPAILVTVAGVVFAAMIARELGGRRRAQLLTAGAYAVCAQFLGTGHYLATSTIDPFLWTVLLWLLARWIRTRSDGLLIWAGVVTGVALNVKFLILGFWLVAGVCLLIFGPRDLLRRPALWAGAAIALAATVPTLIWQANHGWPQLEMGEAISSEETQGWIGRLTFLPGTLGTAGILAGAVLLCYGVWRLLRSSELRPYRFLGWTTLGLAAVFLAVSGRYYYLAGMFAFCWAAAAVEIERGSPARWWRWVPTWPVYLLSLLMLPVTLPLYPASWIAGRPDLPRPVYAAAEIGWPESVDSVAAAYLRLPEARRARTAIITQKYWLASAIDHYGPAKGLPEPASGNRGYFTLTRPRDDTDAVLFVGRDPSRLAGRFADLRPVGTVDNGLGVDNSTQGTPIWLATGRLEPWSSLWPRLRDLGA